jgi:eukaryotic-like serine/threonine-protein kinase
MSLPSGTKLGPYEIQSLLGAGGMGEVYRARDTRLQRDVAIKILPSSLAPDQDRLRRFELEARAVAALNHPNLLTVFDVGAAQLPNKAAKSGASDAAAESPYIVSELLEGTTLRQLLAAGAMRERKAVDFAIQIARGLAAAHERGIVHRDLKPDNIFITDDGRAKILDFGLAKLSEAAAKDADATLDHPATQAGVVLGTVGYMSPEQVRGQAADARSDIFSFGAVLYEMLGGKRAFHGQSAADVMSAILKEEPPELSATNQEISPALDHIVHHCMEKNPQQRFASAGDIAFQLGELSGMRSSTTLASAAAAAATAAAEPASQTKRRWIFAAVGIAVLLAVAAGTWFLARATANIESPRFTQMTYQQGYVDSARFLPDGQSFICAAKWASDTEESLYTGRVDSQGLRPLGVKATKLASVSSTGELLVVEKVQSIGAGYVQTGTLARVPLGGGAPRPILDNVQFADWAPDGKDFLVVRFIPESHAYRLEYPVGKVLYETSGWVSHPRFSRDGKMIAFLDHPIFGDDQGSAAVVDLQGHHKILSGSYGSAQGVAWSPNGDEIWFAAAPTGVSRWIIATTLKGKVRRILSAPEDLDIQDTLPDGRALVMAVHQRHVIMVITPEFPQPRDFTPADWAYGMKFSADSKQILFGDQDTGPNYGVFLRNLDGSPAVRLGDGDPLDISPDGKWAVSRMPLAPDQIMLLPTGSGEPRQLTHSNVNHLGAGWLPDNRLFAVGHEPNHRERTYLVDLNGNEKPLTPEGVRAIVATPDGKRLLVRNQDTSDFALFPMDGGQEEKVPQLQAGDRPFNFSPDGAAIFFYRFGQSVSIEIWRVELSSGKRTLLRTITPGEVPATTIASAAIVSRDGKNFAYEYVTYSSTEYVVTGLK